MLKKLKGSAIFNSWLNIGVKLLTGVIALPFVLSNLSAAETSVWFLFSTIIIMSQSVVVGFNSSFVRYLAYSYSGIRLTDFNDIKNNFQFSATKPVNQGEFSSLFIVLKRVAQCSGLIVLILLSSIGTLALYGPITEMANTTDGWIAWVIIVISTTLVISNTFYQIYLEGISQVAKVQITLAKVNLFGLFVTLIVLSISPTLVNIVLVYQSVALTNVFFLRFVSVRINDKFLTSLPKSKFKINVFKVVFKTSWKNGITTIIASVVQNISGLLVANILVPIEAASFLLTKRLFEIIDQFTRTSFNAKLPNIATLRGKGDLKNLIPLIKKLFYLSYFVYMAGYIGLILFGDFFLTIIDSKTSLGSVPLIICFSFAHFISRWGGMIGVITNQSNLVLEHIAVVFYSIAFFIFIYLLYDNLGSLVFPLGVVVGVILASLTTFSRAYKTINTNFFKFESKLFIPVLLMLGIVNLLFYWSSL